MTLRNRATAVLVGILALGAIVAASAYLYVENGQPVPPGLTPERAAAADQKVPGSTSDDPRSGR